MMARSIRRDPRRDRDVVKFFRDETKTRLCHVSDVSRPRPRRPRPRAQPCYHPQCFSNAIFFSREIFRNASLIRTPLGYSLPHLLVYTFQKSLLPRESVWKKSEVPRGWLPFPRSQLLDKIGTKFQRLPACFRGQGIQRYYWGYCST